MKMHGDPDHGSHHVPYNCDIFRQSVTITPRFARQPTYSDGWGIRAPPHPSRPLAKHLPPSRDAVAPSDDVPRDAERSEPTISGRSRRAENSPRTGPLLSTAGSRVPSAHSTLRVETPLREPLQPEQTEPHQANAFVAVATPLRFFITKTRKPIDTKASTLVRVARHRTLNLQIQSPETHSLLFTSASLEFQSIGLIRSNTKPDSSSRFVPERCK